MNDVFEFMIKNKSAKTKTIESFAMLNYVSGDVFYTHKQDKDITAIANYYKRSVKTERMIAIDSEKHSRIETITKVTLL